MAASCCLAIVAGVLWLVHLGIRRPCYPGYVRLIDLDPVLPVVAAVVAVTSGALLLLVRSRPAKRRGIARRVAAVVLLVFSVLLVVGAVGSVASDHGRYDSSCWTF